MLQRWLDTQVDKDEALRSRDKKHAWAPLIYTAASRGHADVVTWLINVGYVA